MSDESYEPYYGHRDEVLVSDEPLPYDVDWHARVRSKFYWLTSHPVIQHFVFNAPIVFGNGKTEADMPEMLKDVLKEVIEDTRDRCWDNCKNMYFCDLPLGHEGIHIDEWGLSWENYEWNKEFAIEFLLCAGDVGVDEAYDSTYGVSDPKLWGHRPGLEEVFEMIMCMFPYVESYEPDFRDRSKLNMIAVAQELMLL